MTYNNRQSLQQAIRLAILGMVANNEDHTFEKMCYDYSFLKICDNIVMPTGGGHGDKGRDFYTIPIYKNGVKNKEIAFLCSLNKKYKDKIKSDLESLNTNFPQIDTAYFFSGVDISEYDRYNLIKYAKANYNVELTIVDLNQLSQLLSNIKNYDIVDIYLHISSSLYPRPEEDNWYANLYQKYQENYIISFEDFREVVAALRETTSNVDLRMDANFWINKIQNFYNTSEDFYSKSRALYEIAHSKLKGLNNLNAFKESFINYVNQYEATENLIIIEDAICLINYALGTIVQGVTYPDYFISNFHNKIKTTLVSLLETSNDINRARLLFLNILLSFKQIVLEQEDDNSIIEQIENLLTEMELHPFFSASKVDDTIKLFFQEPLREKLQISKVTADELQNRIDQLISKQEGDGILGERIRDRMVSFVNSNDFIDAIKEGHKLKKAWSQQDSYYGCVLSTAILAFCYEKIGLYYAAKYYYLISIRMCIFSDNPYLFSKAMHPLYSLAKLEYKLGNWLAFFKLLDIYFTIYYLTERKELELNDEESQELIYYTCIIKKTASFDSRYDKLVNDIIKNLNCDDNLKQNILVDLQQDLPYHSLNILWQELQKHIENRPFSDINVENAITFNTSGLEWNISYKNINSIHIIVEEFIAILQILLTEMQGLDIMHIQTRIAICIEGNSNNSFKLEELPDNDCFKYKILIPEFNINFDINKFIPEILSCSFTIIEKCSLWKQEKMFEILEQLFKNNLVDKMCFFSSYRNSYSRLYEIKEGENINKLDIFNVNETYYPPNDIVELFQYDNISPLFNESDIKDVIQRRYDNSYEFLKPTLEILRKNDLFKTEITEYKQKGFLDWEILMAMSNILMDYKLKEEIEKTPLILTEEQKYQLYHSKAMIIAKNRAKYNSPPSNINIFFDKEMLNMQLKMNYTIELKRLGLHIKTQTPKFNAIRDFLNTRFNYNIIDVPHENII